MYRVRIQLEPGVIYFADAVVFFKSEWFDMSAVFETFLPLPTGLLHGSLQ